MTSSSALGYAQVTLQFDLSRATTRSPRSTPRRPTSRPTCLIRHSVRIRDIAISAPENDLIAGWFNNARAIILAIQRQPGANVIETVARIKKALPVLEASIPAAVKVNIVSDRTETIRASITDVQTVALVVMTFCSYASSGQPSFRLSLCPCH
jgi:multidrug efflux pump subunit AcrB